MMASSDPSFGSSSPNTSLLYSIDEDISVVSSVSSHGADSLLPASPSSCGKQVTVCLDDEKAVPSLPSRRSLLIRKCYGNTDVSDRIGRTLSLLLLARLAVSILLATMEGGE